MDLNKLRYFQENKLVTCQSSNVLDRTSASKYYDFRRQLKKNEQPRKLKIAYDARLHMLRPGLSSANLLSQSATRTLTCF